MILVTGFLRIAPEAVAANRDAMRTQLEATRAEDGCVFYNFSEDVLEPGLIHIAECWRDQAALDAHGKTPHMAAFNAVMGAARPTALQIDAWQAEGPRRLIG